MSAEAAAAVFSGLFAAKRSLPTWLLYDDAGCALYEQITTLPEYYLTRAETAVLAAHADAIVALATDDGGGIALAEIGAGSATKTELLLAAALRRTQHASFLACDIAPGPLAEARARLQGRFPGLAVSTFAGRHLQAGPAIAALPDRQVLLFLGSSIGNYPDAEAIALLGGLRPSLRPGALLVLGTDMNLDPATVIPAYDDAAGVTSAFSLNVLTRLNREYDATFDLCGFRHAARWRPEHKNIEISLQSLVDQRVTIGALGREVQFAAGEHVHLETCAKYDQRRVDGILAAAGFRPSAQFRDESGRYAVQVAVAAPR